MWFSINNPAIGALVVLLLLISLVSVAQDDQDNMGATFETANPKKSNRSETADTRPQTLALQVDSPVYWVKTKVGKEYYCNIIAMTEGNYMTIKTYDGSTLFLQWSDIDSFKLTAYKANSPELAAFKKTEDFRANYNNWGYCYLTKGKTDTLRARIKKVIDYSLNDGTPEAPVIVVLDEQNAMATPVNYTLYDGLEMLSADHYKFAICGDDGKEIYRIVVDGPCKLLSQEFRTEGGSMFLGNGSGGGTYMPSMPVDKVTFFLYMNHVLAKVKTESSDNIFIPKVSANFIGKCKVIFRACPALVEKIEQKTLHSNNLVEIVTEFNNCISHK